MGKALQNRLQRIEANDPDYLRLRAGWSAACNWLCDWLEGNTPDATRATDAEVERGVQVMPEHHRRAADEWWARFGAPETGG